jgi:hypothetical protein
MLGEITSNGDSGLFDGVTLTPSHSFLELGLEQEDDRGDVDWSLLGQQLAFDLVPTSLQDLGTSLERVVSSNTKPLGATSRPKMPAQNALHPPLSPALMSATMQRSKDVPYNAWVDPGRRVLVQRTTVFHRPSPATDPLEPLDQLPSPEEREAVLLALATNLSRVFGTTRASLERCAELAVRFGVPVPVVPMHLAHVTVDFASPDLPTKPSDGNFTSYWGVSNDEEQPPPLPDDLQAVAGRWMRSVSLMGDCLLNENGFVLSDDTRAPPASSTLFPVNVYAVVRAGDRTTWWVEDRDGRLELATQETIQLAVANLRTLEGLYANADDLGAFIVAHSACVDGKRLACLGPVRAARSDSDDLRLVGGGVVVPGRNVFEMDIPSHPAEFRAAPSLAPDKARVLELRGRMREVVGIVKDACGLIF